MTDETRVRLLAVSGSLRADSSNTAVLRVACRLAPPGVETILYDGLAGLPAFSPDDDERAPPPVLDLRVRLRAADGVLLSSPEYAHGVPGALKNALDWVVGSGELVDKPVALLNPSPWSTFAHPQLAETLRVMSATLVPDACVTLPVERRLDEDGLLANPAVVEALRAAMAALVAAIAAR